MELLGGNLEELMLQYGGKLSQRTVLLIADQCIRRVKQIHGSLLIHRDIKPENLAAGSGKRANTIYIFDFGLARQYRNPVTRRHIPYKEQRQLVGSLRYSSLNTHRGIEQSRRDDLESLGFVLVYLLKGRLPWQGLHARCQAERLEKVLDVMSSTDVELLTKDLPSMRECHILVEYKKYMEYVRELSFTQDPDYDYLLGLFNKRIATEEAKGKILLDWMSKSVKTIL
eukprot:TRINITY_DN8186_c0_g3_i10.p1 TRINITY_DN8186_c0_g3~~TRINITY_DN8186_c0_g3_i10.p1  ORF type:complete len:227 (+),score=26.36 TRINITY_DN8186_c0_g3_i10:533-1213(+)